MNNLQKKTKKRGGAKSEKSFSQKRKEKKMEKKINKEVKKEGKRLEKKKEEMEEKKDLKGKLNSPEVKLLDYFVDKVKRDYKDAYMQKKTTGKSPEEKKQKEKKEKEKEESKAKEEDVGKKEITLPNGITAKKSMSFLFICMGCSALAFFTTPKDQRSASSNNMVSRF